VSRPRPAVFRNILPEKCISLIVRLEYTYPNMRQGIGRGPADPQDEWPNVGLETCSIETGRESRYGACDQTQCGDRSAVVCASENCSNCPCRRHMKLCPTCGKHFCESSDKYLETCFFEHVREGRCEEEILRAPLSKLTNAFATAQYRELRDFVYCDSDGLGNPLPKEACLNLGLAVAYSRNVIPEYNEDVLIARDLSNRARRTRQQKLRRAAKRHGTPATVRRAPGPARLAPYRNSTIHLVTGALVVRQWTSRWHYRQQIEMLNIMGLSKGQDFIRDRVDYLRWSNPILFEKIESWASALKR